MSKLTVKYYQLNQAPMKFMISESIHSLPLETGGVLIGSITGNCALITRATGPGPNAEHTPTEFRRDGEYSQWVLDETAIQSDGSQDYIGEWHSHPKNSGPSGKDFASLRWIAQNPKYAIAQPVLGICGKQKDDSWIMSFYVLDGSNIIKLAPTS